MIIKGKDIVIIGIQPWDISIGSNCKNIAMELSLHNRVLYVNPPVNRISFYKDKASEKMQKRIRVKKGLDKPLVSIGPNMWNLYPPRIVESINSFPQGKIFDFANKINSQRFAGDILKAIKELNFSNFILFNDSSMFLGYYLPRFIKPSLYIYYMRDFLIKDWYWKKHGTKMEPLVIKKADLVLTNSSIYTEYALQYNPSSIMVGQGCDISLFSDASHTIPVATDLGKIKKPIIGYVGQLLSMRLDIQLLIYLMKQKKDVSLVLIGPEDEEFKASELHHMKNVHFLGSRNMNDLPSYIKGFDVAINPQLLNDFTMGNYPRKVDEYLAMGKPVVATATPAMDYFADSTYLASSYEQWVQLIDKALADDTPERQQKRREVAQSHSWENNVLNIYKAIVQTAEAKKIKI